MQLVGRALTVKLQTWVEPEDPAELEELNRYWENNGGHPQRRMMDTVAASEDGTILCFDCGADMQQAHFGEMSCQVAYAHGCRGMLLAGNCRDTQYILKMDDFPIFSYGTRPNALKSSIITDVQCPILLPGHVTHYVKVEPGDFIFGDNDGVQLIPGELVDEVIERVERTFEIENEERKQLAAGMPVAEVYKNYGVL
jgi:regulator of RNase E activity RraA